MKDFFPPLQLWKHCLRKFCEEFKWKRYKMFVRFLKVHNHSCYALTFASSHSGQMGLEDVCEDQLFMMDDITDNGTVMCWMYGRNMQMVERHRWFHSWRDLKQLWGNPFYRKAIGCGSWFSLWLITNALFVLCGYCTQPFFSGPVHTWEFFFFFLVFLTQDYVEYVV